MDREKVIKGLKFCVVTGDLNLQEHIFMRHVTLELAKEFEQGCQIW